MYKRTRGRGRQGIYGRQIAERRRADSKVGLPRHWLNGSSTVSKSYFDFDGRMNDEGGNPRPCLAIAMTTVGKLADIARQDPDFLQVGEFYRDDPAFDVTRLVAELVERESVPLLPIREQALGAWRKRDEWETTWTLQRQDRCDRCQDKALQGRSPAPFGAWTRRS